MHERDVSVAARASSSELGLALRRRLPVPVTRVNVVGNDLVSQRLHRREHGSAGGEVRGAHVGGLLADDVNHRLLELLHLGRELRRGQTAKGRRVRPGVRGDLVARIKGLLDSGALVVDAAVQGARHEEGGLGAAVVEDVDELGGVLVRAVVVGEGEDARLGALLDHDACARGALDEFHGVLDGDGGRAGGHQESGDNGIEKHDGRIELSVEGCRVARELVMVVDIKL